jgi:hypothetical protein
MPPDPEPLLDHFMPRWEFASTHATLVRADVVATFAAIKRTDLGRSWIVRTLFRLRGLPTSRLTLARLRRPGFVLLGERANRELVLGIAGRFWTPGGDLLPITAATFTTTRQPGTVRAVWGFRVEPAAGGRTVLRTVTRVQAADARSRRLFRLYWFFVAPFSAVIRRVTLMLIRREAEARHRARRIVAEHGNGRRTGRSRRVPSIEQRP